MSSQLRAPIILLGNVRSGTTMIQNLLGLHPEVSKWFEPRTVWVYADPSRRHDRFDESDATPRVIRYIRRRFLDYQEDNGGLRIMEKTPSNVLRIPYVRAVFPEAKLLYLIRNPWSYLSSSELKWQEEITWVSTLKRLRQVPKSQVHHYGWRYVKDQFQKKILKRKYVSTWGVRYPGIYEDIPKLGIEQVIAKQWAYCSDQAERDLAKMDAGFVFRLRYEDFVSDPLPWFEKILHYVDLDMTSEMRDAIKNTVDPGRQEKWKRLESGSLASCFPILASEMRRHEYEIPSGLRALFSEPAIRNEG